MVSRPLIGFEVAGHTVSGLDYEHLSTEAHFFWTEIDLVRLTEPVRPRGGAASESGMHFFFAVLKIHFYFVNSLLSFMQRELE